MNNGEYISGMPVEKRHFTPPLSTLRGSHISRILQRDLALGSERNILHSGCLCTRLEPLAVAPYCSSLVWLGNRISHPQEMPPSGPGRDPSISTPGERMCVCAHTCACVCVWWCWGVGETVECFLLSRSGRDLRTTCRPSPLPPACWGSAQSVPLPWPPPSP